MHIGLRPVLLAAIILIAAWSLLEKPIHVDDPNYLGVAVRILENPLDPYGKGPVWDYGEWFDVNANPPLWSYTLAAGAWIFGWNDLVFHVLAAFAYGLLVVGCFRLAERVSNRPLLWTTGIAFAPFLLPGCNLMLDVPMLALWVWALEWQFRAWSASDLGAKRPTVWIAGLLAAAAILTKYSAVLVWVLFVLGTRHYRKPAALWSALPAVILVGLWIVHNVAVYGQSHLGAQDVAVSFASMPERIRILLRSTGSVLWLTPAWASALMSWHRKLGSILLSLMAAMAVVVGWLDQSHAAVELASGGLVLDFPGRTHFAVFSGNGLAALLTAGLLVWRRTNDDNGDRQRARAVLIDWAVLGLAFNLFAIAPASFGAIRHLNVFLIPLCLAMADPVERAMSRSRWVSAVAYVSIAGSVVLGALLAHADLVVARVYRDVARELIPPLTAHNRVWFTGDSSLRYYAEQEGAMHLRQADPAALLDLQPNDIVVVPQLQSLGILSSPMLSHSRRLGVQEWRSRNPCRTISMTTNYYGATRVSLGWEIAPGYITYRRRRFEFTRPIVERVGIYQVP